MGAQNKENSGRNYDSEALDWEGPVHSVTLSDFFIGETVVTQALWKEVMGSNPSYLKGDSMPVVNVSWNDCQEFIYRLNKVTGRDFRLPTEAEWEFAARGGNQSRGYKYAGSNTTNDVAWYVDNSDGIPSVRLKSPNELGLYDMSGCVWEWCGDSFCNYNNVAQINPKESFYGSSRVLRGGSWSDVSKDCRVSFRYLNEPGSKFNNRGFRLCHPG